MFIPFHDDIPTRRTPLVTYLLVAVNVLVFLWIHRLPELQEQVLAYQHGFVPARIMQLSQPKPIFVPIEVAVYDPFFGEHAEQRAIELAPAPGQIWLSLFTCMFLHGSWMHLLFNMWFLWLFGKRVEDRLGPVPYLLFYVIGGLIASATHWAVAPTSMTPVIGASGAIAAVLGAYAITWPWARIGTLLFLFIFFTVVEVPALVVLGVWFLAQVLAGQESLHGSAAGGVAWWAHVGGFLAGMALMPLFNIVAILTGRTKDRGDWTAD
jgi:membrane associated rhomboid family serine protease